MRDGVANDASTCLTAGVTRRCVSNNETMFSAIYYFAVKLCSTEGCVNDSVLGLTYATRGFFLERFKHICWRLAAARWKPVTEVT